MRLDTNSKEPRVSTDHTTIQCPHCGGEINVNDVLYHQMEVRFKVEQEAQKKQFAKELEAKRVEYSTHLASLNAREEQLKLQEERQAQSIKSGIDTAMKVERERLRAEEAQKARLEHTEALRLLQEELSKKQIELQEKNALEIKLSTMEREKANLEISITAKKEQELNEKLVVERENIKKYNDDFVAQKLREHDESVKLKMLEKDKQLEDQKRLIDEMKRKAEQGSMQIQGEVQELAIEEWLGVNFPFDMICEVKKGAFGADCIQTVHTRELQNCGIICYESKNTKAWSDGWIAKLKSDMLAAKADIGVLVTAVYPSGLERMGWVDDIWVCTLEEFKGSAALIRQSLITTHRAVSKEENKGDKMALLYNYLTGNEFAMQLNSIVAGFTTMQEELDKERRSLMASWKRRQKLIDGVLVNTTEMYGSLQGIAGNAIGHIQTLELPYIEDEEL